MALETYMGLEYLDANPAAPRVVLVLHWGGASGRIGVPFAQLLPGWRVVAPSFRGHGRNAPPTASAEVCGQDIRALLEHLGIKQVDRLYAYSVGAYVATRLFGHIRIASGVLLGGGVVPFGVALPNVFDEPATAQPETEVWLAEQHARLTSAGDAPEDVEAEWAAMRGAYEDILDLSQPYLTLRLTAEDMRPAIVSIWEDDYFAQADAPTPQRLLFWNANSPTACKPYIEQFECHPGCREVTLDVDPFDVDRSTVRRVIRLLEEE